MTSDTAGGAEKLPPIHPGEILEEEFLRPMKISQYRLAKSIGVDTKQVHAIVNGKRGISAETALLFSRFFGNSAGFWMGLQSQYDLEVAEEREVKRREGEDQLRLRRPRLLLRVRERACVGGDHAHGCYGMTDVGSLTVRACGLGGGVAGIVGLPVGGQTADSPTARSPLEGR